MMGNPLPEETGATRTLEQRFATLEDASRNLSLDVQALTETLKVVSQLQLEQREQRRKQQDMDAAITKARAEAVERNNRTRRTFAWSLGLMAVILPLVSVLVYWALLTNVNQLLKEQRAGSFASCTTRNKSTMDQAAREQALADADEDEDTRALHTRSAQQLRTAIVDCSRFK